MTKDDSLSWHEGIPKSIVFDDTYYSSSDGYEESKYVFLELNNIPKAWENKNQFVISETGFGTGLNFLITVQQWLESRKYRKESCTENIKKNEKKTLIFQSCEAYPLTKEQIQKAISMWPQLGIITSIFLERYPDASNRNGKKVIQFPDWDIELHIHFEDIHSALTNYEKFADCWYLDGFAPSKNPQMWDKTTIKLIAKHSKKNTTIATFTAAGAVRRRLQAFGFTIEKVAGFGTKRECIKGMYLIDSKVS